MVNDIFIKIRNKWLSNGIDLIHLDNSTYNEVREEVDNISDKLEVDTVIGFNFYNEKRNIDINRKKELHLERAVLEFYLNEYITR